MAAISFNRSASTPHGEAFTWQAHPARQRPRAAMAALVAILAIALACGAVGGWWWGGVAIVVLVVSLGRFYFPSRFLIDDEGVTARYLFSTQRRRWSEIRRVVRDEHGVFLSRRRRRSRWDAYGGLHLLFGSRRDDVLREIAARTDRLRGIA